MFIYFVAWTKKQGTWTLTVLKNKKQTTKIKQQQQNQIQNTNTKSNMSNSFWHDGAVDESKFFI